jgi:hypothetical protein
VWNCDIGFYLQNVTEMWPSIFGVVLFGFFHGDSSVADSLLLDLDLLCVSLTLLIRVCIELSDALQWRALGFA